jgi:RNA polymerase sigma factor
VQPLLLMLFKRWLGKPARRKIDLQRESDSLNARIGLAQSGESSVRERLIADYRPFILKVTSRFCKQYIDPARDDEFSIALIAFDEAISQFSPESGRSFTGFAETVIRRRLIDHVRKEQRHVRSLPAGSFHMEDDEEQFYTHAFNRQAVLRFNQDQDAEERRLEILEFTAEIAGYGIRFSDLAESSPKHEDSRILLQGIGIRLARQDRLFSSLRESRRLPVMELTELSGVSRKTIERNRKYLIAVALLVHGQYPYLKHYLHIEAFKQQIEKAAGGTRL